MRRITKYANRKLYDVVEVAYVSMVEISDAVARGERVSVTCDVTGRDVTLDVLSRALYERIKRRDRSHPEPFGPGVLARLIARVPILRVKKVRPS
jgi:polyhydroxyalkanoate synthesis regulator protein